MKKNRKNVVLVVLFILVVLVGIGKIFLDKIYVPVIAMYHYIDDNESNSKLSVSAEGFEKQMKFFKENGYDVIPLKEIVNMIKNKKKVPHKTIAITFDDGADNNYSLAYQILRKYGFSATMFVISDMVGKQGYMNWSEIKEMQDNGITIGSHTVSHRWLPELSDQEIEREVTESKKVLENSTGRNINFIAYPSGGYDQRVIDAVKKAGYLGACTTNSEGSDWRNIYALKRVRLSRTSNNPVVQWIETSGYYTFIKEFRDDK
jgi:peptidoglycan/xylan/chitin deacetylase (PgdA/CDA1 family)